MRRAIAFLACALAAACAAPEPATVSSPEPESVAAVPAPAITEPSYTQELLAYLARLRSMNEAALNAEAARVKRDTSELGRVKAAIAHTLALRAAAAATTATELREERKVAESQKQRAETLQQKLDALTEVEKSLAEREKEAR
jgi:hypothetical protein